MVAFGQRLHPHGRKIRTGLRLGQIHRTGPLAGREPREIQRLLLGRTVMPERLDHAGGQHRREAERHVGAVPHLLHGGRNELGQTLPAKPGIAGDAVPAAFNELPVRFGIPVRQHDSPVGEARALAITDAIQRIEDVLSKARRTVEHRAHELRRDIGKRRKRRYFIESCQLVQDEQHVLQRRFILRHDLFH